MIYLDYAASTPIDGAVLSILQKSMQEDFANPAAAHKLGKKLNKNIESFRTQCLGFLKANKYEFIFTSSASESNNLALGHSKCESNLAMVTHSDHPSIVNPVKERFSKVIEIPLLKNGKIDIDSLLNLDELSQVNLVSFAHVNNQTGTEQNILEICKKLKEKNPNIYIHIDGVQALGRVDVNLSNVNLDSYAISSHKIYGPKGIAGLYFKKDKITPMLHGGGHELGFRSSTPAYPLIKSFTHAIEVILNNQKQSIEKISSFNKQVREAFLGEFNISFLNEREDGATHILCFLIPGISSDIILRHLEVEDIFVSSSSACSSKAKGTSPVFKALGIEEKLHKFVLRVSFGTPTTQSEIDQFIRVLKSTLSDLKHLMR